MNKQAQPKVVIPVSKRKVILALAGCLLFVGLGIALLRADLEQIDQSRGRHSLAEVRIVGVMTIVIFGTFFLLGVKRFRHIGPGLILDHQSITIATTTSTVEQIKWAEIERITITKIRSQKFLTLHLRNPQKHLRGKSWLYRCFTRINMKYWGSPFHISSGPLQIRFNELIALIQQYHEVTLD